MAATVEVKPIAFFRTRKKHSYEAARQGAIDVSDEIGEIRFESQQNFEQALDGIEGFSHLWVLYQFHQNPNWKPKIMPPRGRSEKIGVFATRSPHRPNALGLSCVELIEREDLVLRVQNFDLLDETPIFDIKPYIPYADSFPDARVGWLADLDQEKYDVQFTPRAQAQIEFLKGLGIQELQNFLLQQLQFEPLNSKKKRVRLISHSQNEMNSTGTGVLAYRTWRAEFSILNRDVSIQNIFSGYTAEDLARNAEDPYRDKDSHRRFLAEFPPTSRI
jgi:tRNA-Thr(GGU) m(6)t(6)A37 methyltransferase TsaA